MFEKSFQSKTNSSLDTSWLLWVKLVVVVALVLQYTGYQSCLTIFINIITYATIKYNTKLVKLTIK